MPSLRSATGRAIRRAARYYRLAAGLVLVLVTLVRKGASFFFSRSFFFFCRSFAQRTVLRSPRAIGRALYLPGVSRVGRAVGPVIGPVARVCREVVVAVDDDGVVALGEDRPIPVCAQRAGVATG
jgi:hypothetical protein